MPYLLLNIGHLKGLKQNVVASGVDIDGGLQQDLRLTCFRRRDDGDQLAALQTCRRLIDLLIACR